MIDHKPTKSATFGDVGFVHMNAGIVRVTYIKKSPAGYHVVKLPEGELVYTTRFYKEK